jgi:hypothetical protein
MADTIFESLSAQREELLRLRDEALRICERHAHHQLKDELAEHLRIVDSGIDHLEKAMRKAREVSKQKVASQ